MPSITQNKHHVEHYVRQPDGQWLFSEASGLDSLVQLPSIECSLPLAEIYHKVQIGLGNE